MPSRQRELQGRRPGGRKGWCDRNVVRGTGQKLAEGHDSSLGSQGGSYIVWAIGSH